MELMSVIYKMKVYESLAKKDKTNKKHQKIKNNNNLKKNIKQKICNEKKLKKKTYFSGVDN